MPARWRRRGRLVEEAITGPTNVNAISKEQVVWFGILVLLFVFLGFCHYIPALHTRPTNPFW